MAPPVQGRGGKGKSGKSGKSKNGNPSASKLVPVDLTNDASLSLTESRNPGPSSQGRTSKHAKKNGKTDVSAGPVDKTKRLTPRRKEIITDFLEVFMSQPGFRNFGTVGSDHSIVQSLLTRLKLTEGQGAASADPITTTDVRRWLNNPEFAAKMQRLMLMHNMPFTGPMTVQTNEMRTLPLWPKVSEENDLQPRQPTSRGLDRIRIAGTVEAASLSFPIQQEAVGTNHEQIPIQMVSDDSGLSHGTTSSEDLDATPTDGTVQEDNRSFQLGLTATQTSADESRRLFDNFNPQAGPSESTTQNQDLDPRLPQVEAVNDDGNQNQQPTAVGSLIEENQAPQLQLPGSSAPMMFLDYPQLRQPSQQTSNQLPQEVQPIIRLIRASINELKTLHVGQNGHSDNPSLELIITNQLSGLFARLENLLEVPQDQQQK